MRKHLKDALKIGAVVEGLTKNGGEAAVQVLDVALEGLIVEQEGGILGVEHVIRLGGEDGEVVVELPGDIDDARAEGATLEATDLDSLQLHELQHRVEEPLQHQDNVKLANSDLLRI